MALIVPFQGVSYNPAKIADLSQVVAPPYDVISPREQDELYRRHPCNIIRLILNKETPSDTSQNNRYTRSAAHYRNWLDEGFLLRAPDPHFYFLEETFDSSLPALGGPGSPSRKFIRRGFIGLIRLEEFSAGVVLPHEKTQTKPKADRLALMEACQANLSQIFSLYVDEEGAMASMYDKVFSSPQGPDIDLTDDQRIRHRLWKVREAKTLGQVQDIMRAKKVFIADGHHRYETALAYRDRQRSRFPRHTGREPFNSTMMYLAAMEDQGLLILPTHRVILNLQSLEVSSFMERVSVCFDIESFPFDAQNSGTVRERFSHELASRSDQGRSLGMLLKETNQFFLLTLKNSRILDETAPGLSPSLKALDVNLLHILIFRDLLKIGPEDLTAGKYVLYCQDAQEAVAAVRSGKGQMAFFLNPTKAYQVRDVSLAGETMPSKSTFFYPKLLSGLVINPLDPGGEIFGD